MATHRPDRDVPSRDPKILATPVALTENLALYREGDMRALISVGLLIVAAPAFADEDLCGVIVKHGIYNIFRQQENNTSASVINNQICQSYSLFEQHQLGADANGNYALIASGAARFTEDQVKAIGQAMCSQSFSKDDVAAQKSMFEKILSPDALNKVGECIESSKKGLIKKIEHDDDLENFVKIVINYEPVGRPGINYFNHVDFHFSEARIVRLDSDDDFLAIEREMNDLSWHWYARRKDDRLLDQYWGLYSIVAKTNPTGLVSAAVKLRLLLHPDLGMEIGERAEDYIALRQILGTLEHEISRQRAAAPDDGLTANDIGFGEPEPRL